MKTYAFQSAAFATIIIVAATTVQAGPLMDRIAAGESVRIGFAAEPPFAYPGDNGESLGFANAIAIGTLEKMGYTNVEPVVTDWGGLVPALAAGRLDIITGGMYILGERCKSVSFSDPVAAVGDAFIVPKGNPKTLNTYAEVAAQGAILATVSGHNTNAAATREGVAEANMMQLPGVTEVLAAVQAGRADAGIMPALSAIRMAALNPDTISATEQTALPEWTLSYVGLGFRPEDDDFRKAFNAALKDYIGSDAMMAAVAPFEYLPSNLPGDVQTDWVCANR